MCFLRSLLARCRPLVSCKECKFSKYSQLIASFRPFFKSLKSPRVFRTSFMRWQTSKVTKRGKPRTFVRSSFVFIPLNVSFAPSSDSMVQLFAALSQVSLDCAQTFVNLVKFEMETDSGNFSYRDLSRLF